MADATDQGGLHVSLEAQTTMRSPFLDRPPRNLAFIINDRCPLRCKHCAVGYWDENSGSQAMIAETDLRQSILAVDRELYDTIVFVGGEPTLVPNLLRVGIETCQEVGFLSAITTAPIWASTPDLARRFLQKLPHVDILTLSYDVYHLEFLRVDHYTNAAVAAIAQDTRPAFNVCHSDDTEKITLLNKIHHLLDKVEVHCQKVLPVGNATIPTNVPLSGIEINSVDDLDLLERSCDVGNGVVDTGLNLHGCCWSSSIQDSPFHFASEPKELAHSLVLMEKDPTFQKFRQHGLVDSLSDADKAAIVNAKKGEIFINECDLCLSLMTKKNRLLWNQCFGARESSSDLIPSRGNGH